MATWQDLSRDNLAAARLLATEDYARSSVSRSYYAAYCTVTDALATRGTSFAYGWGNPPHEQILDYIDNNLPLTVAVRSRLRKAMRILRRAREDADYRPGLTIERPLTLECLRLARFVIETVGASHG